MNHSIKSWGLVLSVEKSSISSSPFYLPSLIVLFQESSFFFHRWFHRSFVRFCRFWIAPLFDHIQATRLIFLWKAHIHTLICPSTTTSHQSPTEMTFVFVELLSMTYYYILVLESIAGTTTYVLVSTYVRTYTDSHRRREKATDPQQRQRRTTNKHRRLNVNRFSDRRLPVHRGHQSSPVLESVLITK